MLNLIQREQINIMNTIKNKAPFGAPPSLHWRSKSLVRSAIEICLLHFFICKLAVMRPTLCLLWRGQSHSADVNLCLFINFQFQGHEESGNIFSLEHLDTFHMYRFKPDTRDIWHILPGATFIDLEQVDVRKVCTIYDIVALENFVKCT